MKRSTLWLSLTTLSLFLITGNACATVDISTRYWSSSYDCADWTDQGYGSNGTHLICDGTNATSAGIPIPGGHIQPFQVLQIIHQGQGRRDLELGPL